MNTVEDSVFDARYVLNMPAIEHAIDSAHPDLVKVYAQGVLDGMNGTKPEKPPKPKPPKPTPPAPIPTGA